MTEETVSKPNTGFKKFKEYKHKPRRYNLEVGQRGFIATCNFREKECVRECLNILRQYADELYGPESSTDADEEQKSEIEEKETDIADDLQKEIDAAKAAAKPGRNSRFTSVDSGAKNCVFIKTTLKEPAELGYSIIKDIADSKIQRTRHVLRLIPIEVICVASMEAITKAAGILFDKHFLKGGKTFSVVFNRKLNNELKRDDVIKVLADLVFEKNIQNKVDLKHAELSIIVEIIKNKCCLSVAKDYFKYKRYNLAELGVYKPSDFENVEEMTATASQPDIKKEEITEEEPSPKKSKN